MKRILALLLVLTLPLAAADNDVAAPLNTGQASQLKWRTTDEDGVHTPHVIVDSGGGASSAAAYTSSATKTRPADTTAYTAGDVIAEDASAGTVWTFAAVGPEAGSIMITGVSMRWDVAAVPSGASSFRVHLYDASPTAINDNAAYDLPSGDRAKYLGFVDIPTPTDLGATLWGQDDAARKAVKLATGSTSLFAIAETRGAYTPTSAATYTIEIQSVKLAD